MITSKPIGDSRLAQIESHTHPVSIAEVHKSKKVYDRKRGKAEMKKALPYEAYVSGRKTNFYYATHSSSISYQVYSSLSNANYTP